MRLVLVTPPSPEPLTPAEARARLNIGSEVTDVVLGAFIKASRQMIDGGTGWLGRALITQTWRLYLDEFPRQRRGAGVGIRVPLPPLQSITSITYVDPSGSSQTLSEADYVVLPGEPAEIVPAYGSSWPSVRDQHDAVTVEFVCGYGNAGSAVDEPIRSAIALMVSNLRSLSARNLYVSNEDIPGVLTRSFVVGANAGAAIDAAVDALLSPYRVYG